MFWCVVDPLLLSAGLNRASSKRARKVNGNFLQCAAAVVKRNFHALQVKTVSRVRNKRNEEEVGVEAAQQPNSHNLLLFFCRCVVIIIIFVIVVAGDSVFSPQTFALFYSFFYVLYFVFLATVFLCQSQFCETISEMHIFLAAQMCPTD